VSDLQDWKDKVGDVVEVLYNLHSREIEALEDQIGSLELEANAACPDCPDKDKEIDALEAKLSAVGWGNCKRGCPPAYLVDGFCSPACALGAPRGQFVTLKAS